MLNNYSSKISYKEVDLDFNSKYLESLYKNKKIIIRLDSGVSEIFFKIFSVNPETSLNVIKFEENGVDLQLVMDYNGKGPYLKVEINPENIPENLSLKSGKTISEFSSVFDLADIFLQVYKKFEKQNFDESKVEKQKNKEISVVGDLDGNFDNFIRLSMEAGIIDKEWNYIAGDKNVVYLGDILADRTAEGFKILDTIKYFEKIANEKGGTIDVLAGNHDEFMIGVISGKSLTKPLISLMYHERKIGLLDEIFKYADGKVDFSLELLDILKNFKNILENMKNSESGRKKLELIKNLKLCSFRGDSLFFHCPPNKKMIYYILAQKGETLEEKVSNLNFLWKNMLEDVLGNQTGIYDENFLDLTGTFLNTLNDVSEGDVLARGGKRVENYREFVASNDEEDYYRLRELGVKNIFHGHTDGKMPENISGVKVFGLNRKSFKSSNDEKDASLDFSEFKEIFENANIEEVEKFMGEFIEKVKKVPEIIGSNRSFSGEEIGELFEELVEKKSNFEIFRITRSNSLRDLAKAYLSRF